MKERDKINIRVLCDELIRLKTIKSNTNHIVDDVVFKRTKNDIKDAQCVIKYMMELN